MSALVEIMSPELDKGDTTELSVVIPLYNEREVITVMYERLTAVLGGLQVAYELVLVDDGSRDDTPAMMRQLVKDDPAV